ncbi:unnamed protein product [Periconia digitata]|uniref:Reverse transcriptase domain-containing protein n=1 Tax=Periconia digitata TaxID=1303443 RepID=A0A9W4UB32_9PLEO|nr:unnamed protein product [Periconia digitata]
MSTTFTIGTLRPTCKYAWSEMDKAYAKRVAINEMLSEFGPPEEVTACEGLEDGEDRLRRMGDCLVRVLDGAVPVEARYERPKRKSRKPNKVDMHGKQCPRRTQPVGTHHRPNNSLRPTKEDAGDEARHKPHAVALAIKKARWRLQPKPTIRTQQFKAADGKVAESLEEKTDMLCDAVWKGGWRACGSESEYTGPPPVPPLPHMSTDREEYYAQQELIEGELMEALKNAPSGKAAGPDNIAYDLLKAARKVIHVYLVPIFNAFLRHCKHPDHFKNTITVAVHKAGKPRDAPDSYRPITIIDCLAKLYERIVSNRLTTLVFKHPDLIPNAQYGSPGQGTGYAVERAINFALSQWLMGKKVTIYGLDLSGAYDHVLRDKLLEILARSKVPAWLVRTIHSFLSNRLTDILLPGENRVSEKTREINIGAPQGSPLSSILFLFYAAELLKVPGEVVSTPTTDGSAGLGPSSDTDTFAYVDDTTIIIASNSYAENNRKFEAIHAKLLEKGDALNLVFSPSKYNVFHLITPYARDNKSFSRFLLPKTPAFNELMAQPPSDDKDKAVRAICPQNLRMLGVSLDDRLSGHANILAIQKKVRAKMALFRRTYTSTWGATVEQCRLFYQSTILGIFTYCAEAWFIYSPESEKLTRYRLTVKNLNLLESVQTECLISLSGARRGTKGDGLAVQMGVPNILDKLYAVAM